MPRNTRKEIKMQGGSFYKGSKSKPNDSMPKWIENFSNNNEEFSWLQKENKPWRPPHKRVIRYSKQKKEAKNYVARKRENRRKC